MLELKENNVSNKEAFLAVQVILAQEQLLALLVAGLDFLDTWKTREGGQKRKDSLSAVLTAKMFAELYCRTSVLFSVTLQFVVIIYHPEV